jgi:hypothetical protein
VLYMALDTGAVFGSSEPAVAELRYWKGLCIDVSRARFFDLY